MWTEASYSVPYFLHMGSLHSPMICKCLLKVLCPVSRTITTLVLRFVNQCIIIQFKYVNHQTDATIFQFIVLTFIYSSTCFGRLPAHHQELNNCSGSLWFYLRIVVIVVLCSWSGRPADRPDHEHSTTITTIRR
jgi:hypothetical protein